MDLVGGHRRCVDCPKHLVPHCCVASDISVPHLADRFGMRQRIWDVKWQACCLRHVGQDQAEVDEVLLHGCSLQGRPYSRFEHTRLIACGVHEHVIGGTEEGGTDLID